MAGKKKHYGVITGDIIDSSRLDHGQRKKLVEALKSVFKSIEQHQKGKLSGPSFEIYRGDSFQGVITDPGQALEYAILIRASLRKSFDTKIEDMWDARTAIGIGEIEQFSKKIAESDGTAFRNSGPVLDQMKADERILIKTPWNDLNDEFRASCALLDIVVSKWSASQAEVVVEQLNGLNQLKISEKLGISQSAVHQRIKAAHWEAVEKLLNRYRSAIRSKSVKN